MAGFRKFVLLAGLGVLLGLAQSALAAPFTVLEVTKEQVLGIERTQYIVQNGSNPLNRFGVERVVLAALANTRLTKPVILQPPLFGNSEFYTRGGDPYGNDFLHSVAAELALGGLDLYIYSPRETFLTLGQCTPQSNCAAAATWGLAAVLDDLVFTRGLVNKAHPGVKPVIGGYSLGGVVAFAAAGKAPHAYSGLILGDSPFAMHGAELQAGYGLLCQGLSAAIAGGQVVDDLFLPTAKLIVQLSLAAPDAPSPIPLFPPGTTNRQAYILFSSTPSPGPPASIFATGIILAAGSVEEDRLFNVSESRANTVVDAANDYVSNASMRDLSCRWSGDPTFVGNLANYTGPILSFEAGLGSGPYADDTLELTGSTNVRRWSYPSFGHSDLSASPFRTQLFSLKILAWIYSDVQF